MTNTATPITAQPNGNYIAGACKRDYRTIKCGRFVWPAASGQLQDMRCPNCGSLLQQTSRRSNGAWFMIAGEDARAIAAPRKRARATAKAAECATVATFTAEHPEPERGTSAWFSWRNQRYLARTKAYDQAFSEALASPIGAPPKMVGRPAGYEPPLADDVE